MDHSLLPATVEKDGKEWQRKLLQGTGEIIETPALCSHTMQPQGYRPFMILGDDKLSWDTVTQWCCAEHRIEYLEALYEQTHEDWQKSKEALEKLESAEDD